MQISTFTTYSFNKKQQRTSSIPSFAGRIGPGHIDHGTSLGNGSRTNLPSKYIDDVPRYARVLDIGMGQGRLVEFFRDKNVNAEGVDIYPPRDKPEQPYFKISKFEDAEYGKNTFDYIFSEGAIFSYASRNSQNPQSALKEKCDDLKKAATILKPGGKIRLALVTDAPEIEEYVRQNFSQVPLQLTDKGPPTYGRAVSYMEFTKSSDTFSRRRTSNHHEL
jgi:hypothetical protein